MELYLAGVNHNDPLGRIELTRWLKRLAGCKGSPPGFVAVEWDERVAARIHAQREGLRQLVADDWPAAPTGFGDSLALTLAYEADTPAEVFPTVEMIWLDADREPEPDHEQIIRDYAERLWRMLYRPCLARGPLPQARDDALTVISRCVWSLSGSGRDGVGERDEKWANRLLNSTANHAGSWATAVVGASHASDREGSLRRILERAGVACTADILRPPA